MKYNSLSIIYPNGSNIANRLKTIEVRSWMPAIPLHTDLLIIENEKYLKDDDEIDLNGRAVAIVKIKSVRSFVKEDIEKACANYWAKDYYSWELYDIRPFSYPEKLPAKKSIYTLELPHCP